MFYAGIALIRLHMRFSHPVVGLCFHQRANGNSRHTTRASPGCECALFFDGRLE